ncbi:hypothetical protein MY4038_004966 [Beauveria bassiana]
MSPGRSISSPTHLREAKKRSGMQLEQQTRCDVQR